MLPLVYCQAVSRQLGQSDLRSKIPQELSAVDVDAPGQAQQLNTTRTVRVG